MPPLAEVLARASVVSLPMRVRFRGVVVREVFEVLGPIRERRKRERERRV